MTYHNLRHPARVLLTPVPMLSWNLEVPFRDFAVFDGDLGSSDYSRVYFSFTMPNLPRAFWSCSEVWMPGLAR